MVPAIGKKYRHFKGKTYTVSRIAVAKNAYREKDLIESLPYNAWAASPINAGDTIVFYSEESGSGKLCWGRSLSSFAETLEIKRFTEVEVYIPGKRRDI